MPQLTKEVAHKIAPPKPVPTIAKRCELCGKQFDTFRERREHLQEAHRAP